MSTPKESSSGSSSKPSGPSTPPPFNEYYDYQEDSQYHYGGPQHYYERGGNKYNKRQMYQSERPNLSQLQRTCVVVGDEEFMYVDDQDEAGAIIEALRVKGGGEPVFLVVTYDPQTKVKNPENWHWVLDMTRGKKWINDEVGQKWICVVVGKPKRRIVSAAPDVRYCKNKLIKIQNKPIFKVRGKREAQMVLRAALETGEVVGLSMDYDHTECTWPFSVAVAYQSMSPLKPRMDRIIDRIFESGLVHYWFQESIRRATRTRREQEQKSKEEDDSIIEEGKVVPLNLDHMQGVFYILVFSFMVSTVVFIVEIMMAITAYK